ncbi:MAG: ABC transporter, partial [Candidatus Moraniibacteriota bacterium]
MSPSISQTPKTHNLSQLPKEKSSVDFAYQDDDTQAVFHNLSLTIPAGQKIGLVGESGSGKTTFAGLILRFMDIQSGSITIDNHNITKIPQDDLRKSIAYVPQEALLFHRTLEQNIAYGKTQINEKELLQSAKDAHALEFINTFPKKFKTIVGERGIKLSGGQKQRVMIARAMLKKTPILILDEATSALDSHSEKLIQQALENLMKNRTTLVIAH